MYVYNIRDTKTRRDLPFDYMTSICNNSEFKLLPILKIDTKLPESSEEILKMAEGMSLLNKDVTREGVIWRSVEPFPKVSFKAKSKSYLLEWDKRK